MIILKWFGLLWLLMSFIENIVYDNPESAGRWLIIGVVYLAGWIICDHVNRVARELMEHINSRKVDKNPLYFGRDA